MTAPTKEDPERLALRSKPRPVTRLNRRTLLTLAVVLTVIVLAAMVWGLRTPQPRRAPTGQELHTPERVSRAEGLDSLPRDYGSLPKPPQLGAPIGELGRPVVKAEQDAGIQPMPERATFASDPEENAIRAQRLRQHDEAEAAAKAPVVLELKGRTERGHDEAAVPIERAASSTAAASSDSLATTQRQNAPGAQEHKEAFLNASVASSTYNSGTLQAPRSAAELKEGWIIKAALVTGINSDLPGKIFAVVTENVYDSATGRLLLVPQGTRLVGRYDSQIAYGQRRVLVVWTRLILPDASSIVLDHFPGADATGQAGLEDRVDWHLDRVTSGAALSTLLGVAAELAAPDRQGSTGAVVIATRESLQDSVNQIGQELTRRNLDIQPTLRIRPGFPVSVIVNKDLVLKPYGH